MNALLDTSRLLEPLTEQQQRVVDLVAEAFLLKEYEWPLYDYLELTLDAERIDTWSVIQSFPQLGRWGYGPLWWVRGAPAMKAAPESEIALTLIGMWQSPALRECVGLSFVLLDFMAAQRQATRPDPRKVTETTVTSEAFKEYLRNERRSQPHPRLTYQLIEHEPAGSFGGRSCQPDTGEWTRTVSREHLEFSNVPDIADYVSRLDRWLRPEPPAAPILSAPAIRLPAAIDHLDDVWRLTHNQWLFDLRGAERIAKLDTDVQSREEFEARLSVLGDLLRTAAKRLATPARKDRSRPLASLEEDVARRVDAGAIPRVVEAVHTLEAVIALRDSREHGAASHRAVNAAAQLGLAFPLFDWGGAWETVTARAVEALSTIRDELRATVG